MFNDIVVPVDGSALADGAVAHAAELARRTGGALHLIRVHVPVPAIAAEAVPYIPDPRYEEEAQETERVWLMRRADDARNKTGLVVTAQFAVGQPVDEIVEAAASRDAQLIVCATHGPVGGRPTGSGA